MQKKKRVYIELLISFSVKDLTIYISEMKSDARILLNKKKLKNKASNLTTVPRRGGRQPSRSAIDARKILNLKRTAKVFPKKGLVRRPHQLNTSIVPYVKRSLLPNRAPNKHVELSSDGNIWITAPSKKKPMVTNSSNFASRAPKQQLKWTPADIDMDNIEYLGIDDVLDMESLPTETVSIRQSRNQLPLASSSSLAEEILNMQNTMVADTVANTPAYQNGRVYVTNLCPSVSQKDIIELFGDVGVIKSVEMPEIGKAIIEFYNILDASQACEIYHNRLLDGQPMKCYMQPNSSPQRLSISQRLGGRIQSSVVRPSPSVSSNSMTRYNPRNVRFTVKLN
ncbi:RRM domain-containing protein [Caerostris darwini]|uniref:RRM domain-containing protein n=1 Tax=Caerostris darwini TaxID=1538125 RepID=A0AAV4MFW0_9ARAC|nr:RRM domain-containing protein [Caerostris darwini]